VALCCNRCERLGKLGSADGPNYDRDKWQHSSHELIRPAQNSANDMANEVEEKRVEAGVKVVF
jgi:hypothetical protein